MRKMIFSIKIAENYTVVTTEKLHSGNQAYKTKNASSAENKKYLHKKL